VAILEIKKWGGHCGAKEKVGGANIIVILHGYFLFFWRLRRYDLPYQTQHGLVNIVKYELAYYSLETPNATADVITHVYCYLSRIKGWGGPGQFLLEGP